MNFYITFADRNKIKKSFLNLRKYLVISKDEVIENIGYGGKEIDDCTEFLINEEIKKMIRDGSVRRKLLAVIYSNPDMNDEAVRQLIHYAASVPSITRVVLLVDRGQHEEFYELFEEVLFFPTIKKVHIVECDPIPVELLDQEN